ncbi:MAG: hypothetical protein QXX35_05590, partial [Desulfurococcaceae archaeon]
DDFKKHDYSRIKQYKGKEIADKLLDISYNIIRFEIEIRLKKLRYDLGKKIIYVTDIEDDYLKNLYEAENMKIIKEGEVNPSKYIGRVRLKLGGAWGEIIAFYILNDPLPKMTNIFYLLHMATYVTTFTTVTIPEIYTGSEEFLKLISNVDDKRGALEFLTRLLRRRYIPEDQYAKALESVNKRHDLTFSNLREELEKREARLIISEYLTQGIPGLIAKLSSIVEQYKDSPIPRESISSIVGEIYIITSSLREVLSEYDKALKVLNDLLTTSGKTITPDRISKIIEELSKML